MSFWAVAQTMTDREKTTAERLEHVGFEVLAPRARFGKVKVAALFPGYVFVRIIDQWHQAQWTIGVLRLIMAGDRPAQCPDFEIEKIRQAIGPNGLVRLPKTPKPPPRTKIVDGSTVRILTGTFRGLNAIYQGSTPRQREHVLLDLLGQREVPVELGPDVRIEAIDAL